MSKETKVTGQPERPLIALAGGGTSGHINPLLAIYEELHRRRPDLDFVYFGTDWGLEARLVPRAGIAFEVVPGYPFLANPREFLKALHCFSAARRRCARYFRQRRPLLCIASGGYVSAPMLTVAERLGIPRVIHEQNVAPGKNNRLMSQGADLVCVSFEETLTRFPKARRVVKTGNPVQDVFFHTDREASRRALGLEEDCFFVLATGGSLGARSINQAILDWAVLRKTEREGRSQLCLPDGRELRLVLAAGDLLEESLERRSSLGLEGVAGLSIEGYLYDMVKYMSAADLIVSRAGAGAGTELAALGKPCILVPYPHAAGDHQRHNAMAFVHAGAGLCVLDQDCRAELLEQEITALAADQERLETMGRAARSLAEPDAAQRIVDEVLRVLEAQ